MAKSQEWWEDVRPRLIEAIPQALSKYQNAKELQNSIQKWQDIIINATLFGYMFDDEIFETNAQAKQQLQKLDKKLKSFLQEYNQLNNHAKVILDNETRNFCDLKTDTLIDNINNALYLAVNKAEQSKNDFQKRGLKVNTTRKPIFSLLDSLYGAYIDISGKELKVSFDHHKDSVSGDLYKFIKPFLDIVEPHINPETLKSILKDSIKRYKKLPHDDVDDL
ncbi:MAG: hypothetical protein GW903_09730 [Alphaproteobacteria bacterium]|nr:hypothetical protein [Alphaproteobacteria bacterium]NCQ89286.1 hypothetical protein [Alphaproteobacteria bacterium]NCT08150.1 hypothetical protein [Alphaproteobacteria bacterium]